MNKSCIVKNRVLVVICFVVFSFCSCDVTGESNEVPEDTILTMNNNIVLTNLTGETSAINSDSRIEVRFTAINIPEAAAAEGSSLIIVGEWLRDSTEAEYNWNNNGDGDLSSEFIDTVTNSSVSYTFFYDAGNSTTNFKIFFDGTWTDAVTDPNSDDGNIKIEFTDFAVAGDVVEVVLDASLAAE